MGEKYFMLRFSVQFAERTDAGKALRSPAAVGQPVGVCHTYLTTKETHSSRTSPGVL